MYERTNCHMLKTRARTSLPISSHSSATPRGHGSQLVGSHKPRVLRIIMAGFKPLPLDHIKTRLFFISIGGFRKTRF